MSGARHSKRLLRSTVAVAAAGAVAFTPFVPLAPLAAQAQEQGLRALDPVTIRIGANDAFTRLEFAGVVGARARVRRAGQDVIVRVASTASPDVSRLKVSPPSGVTKVETRAVTGGTEIVITLDEGAEARSGMADGAVYVNLYETAPEPGEDAPAVVAAKLVEVTTQASDDKLVLDFDWPEAVGAAVFRRGDAVWVVFDTPGRLNMSRAAALGPATDARWSAGPGHVAVRLAAPRNLPVAATADQGRWRVTIGGVATAATGVGVSRDDDGEAALVATMAGATKAVWLTDPDAGDRFAAVTARGPAKGYGDRRRTVELSLIPTAQGLAVETSAQDLAIRTDGDRVTLTRPGGLTLSDPSADLEPAGPSDGPQKASMPGLVLEAWADKGDGHFSQTYRALQDAATQEAIQAGDDPRAPIAARMALARFLVGSGLAHEGIGVMNAIIADAPNMAGEPELRGLRGAARVMVGRLEEAQADFASAAVAGDPASAVWRGYIAGQLGDWAAARQAYAQGAAAVDAFPREWRARFGASHARAAIETDDLEAARALLAYAFSQDASAATQLEARLVEARLYEIQGLNDPAGRLYAAVARAPLDKVAVPARLGAVRLGLASGAIKPDDAAREMEALRWRWRGDETELAVIRELGQLYLSHGQYREALTALKAAGPGLQRLKGASEIQTDLENAFRALFLDGGADGLQPIQALGLFYDFRDVTPVGADGDEIVRRLARRLVDVDLLDQAAELLKHQAETRLEGVAKAQVSSDLAAIYLMARQPEPALQALWGSRTTLLPSALQAERRALEARALTQLSRYDHALEILGADNGPAARDVRAEIAFRQQNWGEAARLYEGLLGDRHETTATALSATEEARVIRSGVAFTLARDGAGLARVSRNYRPFIERARAKTALRVALDVNGAGAEAPTDFAAMAAQADTFTGWVAEMKADYRRKTGGDRPAAARAENAAAAPASAAG